MEIKRQCNKPGGGLSDIQIRAIAKDVNDMVKVCVKLRITDGWRLTKLCREQKRWRWLNLLGNQTIIEMVLIRAKRTLKEQEAAMKAARKYKGVEGLARNARNPRDERYRR